MREKTENFLLTDKLEIHFLELGKISDGKDPIDMTPLEQFCAYLKFAGDSKREDYVEKLQLRFGLEEEKARQYYDEYSRC